MRTPRLIAASLGLTLALAGCADSKPQATPTPTPTPSATPEPTPPAVLLAGLATLGSNASYSANYSVKGSSPGTARIVRTRTAYRFELTTGTPGHLRKAVLIHTPGGTVSCTLSPSPVTCLLVAVRNQPVPALFDAGLQHVFSDYLLALSKPSAALTVETAVAESANEGSCFTVTRVPGQSATVAAGTYCFAPDGLVTRVSYPSGALVLTSRGPAPDYSKFKPPVTPHRLP